MYVCMHVCMYVCTYEDFRHIFELQQHVPSLDFEFAFVLMAMDVRQRPMMCMYVRMHTFDNIMVS